MKKGLALLTAVVIFFSAFTTLPILATADVWDGTASTAWYNDTDTSFILTNAEQLAGLASLVNDGNKFAGKTIKLDTDIDLNNQLWTPIGTGGDNWTYYFSGVFDGQGHTISNLCVNASMDPDNYGCWDSYGANYGLFGRTVGATVRNLGIKNAKIHTGASSGVGALAGQFANGTVLNCYVDGVSLVGWSNVGALVGDASGSTMIGCYSTGITGSTQTATGGIYGVNGTSQRCYYSESLSLTAAGVAATLTANDATLVTIDDMKADGFTDKLNGSDIGKYMYISVDSAFPTLAYNKNAVGMWDGSVDTAWFDTSESEFTLKSAEQLAGLAYLVNSGNSFTDKIVKLGLDVDLCNLQWIAIGTDTHPFSGTFDGQGYEISHLKIDTYASKDTWENYSNYQGLFGFASDAEIYNTGLVNSSIKAGAGAQCGGIVGTAYGTVIQNCYAVDVELQGWFEVGGLIGRLKSDNDKHNTVEACYTYDITVEATGVPTTAGGLIGKFETAASTVLNSYSASDVDNLVGGDAMTGTTMTNCFYKSTVSDNTDTHGAVSRTEEQMKSEEFLTEINKDIKSTKQFVISENSYPILDKVEIAPPTGSNCIILIVGTVVILSVGMVIFTKRKRN